MKSASSVRMTVRRAFVVLSLFAAIILFAAVLQLTVSAAGNISGTVYIDYNMNGARNTSAAAPNRAIDRGIAGVTVSAYDQAGVLQGSSVTSATGAYTIAATGTGPYRIEFTGLPSGYSPSQIGTNNASTIRFVPNGNSTGIDLGILSASEYCQNDPVLVTTCFVGTVSGTSVDPVLISFPYASGTTSTTDSTGVTNPTTHALMVSQNVVGSIWGVAHHRRAQKIFSAAFTKRHAGFRNNNKNTASNDPTGEIFISDPTGTTASLFVNLNSLFGSNVAGNNPHDITDYLNDNPAFDPVGKTGLGDIDLSEDEQTLYVINLFDRKLYAVPLGAGTPIAPTLSTQVQVYDLATLMNPGTGATGCPLDPATPGGQMNLNLRPGGLKVLGSKVYVGLTCTAQSTGNAAQLRAFVYDLNPAGAGSATQVANFALNYPRGCVSNNGTICAPAEWQAWISSITALLDYTPFNQKYLPQPWLTDIEFDQNGFMMVGVQDRTGHQTGNQNGGANTGQVEGVAAGDTLRLSQSGSTWTLENNGSDGTNTTSGAGNGEGPGNGEFYYQEGYTITGNTHSEISLGGLLNVPGYRELVVSAFDPAPTGTLGGSPTYRAGGVVWFNNVTGGRARSYQLFNIDTPNTFGKAAGIGDIEAICNAAPLQIGNRIWNDADSDGVQDPNESAIAGVTVQLWADTNADGIADTQVGTAVTDSGGSYVFGGISNTNMTGGNSVLRSTAYEVRIPSSNFGGGQPLNGLAPTFAVNDPSANGTTRDSDGIVLSGSQVIAGLTTGLAGQNSHIFDFGFKSAASSYSVGNRVWFDTDDDGIIDVGELGIAGVSVSIFADGNSDGQPDSPGSPLRTVTTDAGGYYRFDGLTAGTYVIRINPANFSTSSVLNGYRNTTGNNTADAESFGAVSNAENGIAPAIANTVLSAGILSNTITLSGTAEPLSEADIPGTGSFAGQGSLDSLADMTVDFGFYDLRLSGTVWSDNGAGNAADYDDGQLDAGESGLSGINVRLYNSSGTEIPVGPDGILGTADDAAGGVTTVSGGGYSFSGLPSGSYRVVIDPNGAASSGPTESDPNLNGDNNDNGFPDNTGNFPGRFISGIVNLVPGFSGAMNNNSVTNSTGRTSDPTLDFGLVLAPTAVSIDSVKAERSGRGVNLSWITGKESGNLGFNVYRESGGGRELLTPAFIAGTALRASVDIEASGNAYGFHDDAPAKNPLYYIEDIDVAGNKTLHGPFVVTNTLIPPLGDPRDAFAKVLGSKLRGAAAKLGVRSVRSRDADVSAVSDAANLDGVKIRVRRDGLVRIPFAKLSMNGFDTSSDPQTWQLFSREGEVPIEVGADFISFLGRASDRLHSGETVYYLVNKGEPGQRMESVEGGSAEDELAPAYAANLVVKERRTYVSRILNGEAGNWFGQTVLPSAETSLTIRTEQAHLAKGLTARLSVRLQGMTVADHIVNVSFNGTPLGSVAFDGQQNRRFDFDLPMTELKEGDNALTFRSAASTLDISLVDDVSLEYFRRYSAVGDRLQFSVPAGKAVRVSGFSNPDVSVFEIDASGGAVRKVLVVPDQNGGTYGFDLAASGVGRVFYAEAGGPNSPDDPVVEPSAPSKWRDPENKADLVIIVPEELAVYARQLAAIREAGGLETAVVLKEDIYDEFGDGSESPASIRDFMAFAAGSWRNAPQYVILFGDSTYDPRNYLGRELRAFVPAKLVDTEFMETSADGWYTDFDGDGVEDIAIGRLPAGNAAEAASIVAKLAAYDESSFRESRTALIISDSSFEGFSGTMRSGIPRDVDVRTVERAAGNDAETANAVRREIGAGPLFVSMNGHGSTVYWASNAIFDRGTAAGLANDRLPFFVMMTCLTGFGHDPVSDSLAESLIKARNGAVAVWASSGMTYALDQSAPGRSIAASIFDPERSAVPLGELLMRAKRAGQNRDVRQTWQLIGDPTLILK